ncbi:MAG TPA: hypothetical protein ENN61_04915 [Bacteroidaceae bacterium]|nr:hypothetical protein [Bacteroidaceae bacterium]
MLFTSLVLLVAGLLFSFAHLHYPRNAYKAINNIGSSWMSREILAEVIFLSILLLWYIILRMKIKRIKLLIPEIMAIVSGTILVFFMVKTYMLPSLVELNHPSFPLSFILTALLAGTAVIYFLIKKSEAGLAFRFKILWTLLFFVSVINHLIFRSFNKDLYSLDIFLGFYLAAIIFSLPSLYATIKNKNRMSDVIFLSLALICDLLNRVYTLTYANPAL